MNDFYYTANPQSERDERLHEIEARGISIKAYTDAGVFSKEGLDYGTKLLIESIPAVEGRFLDLGCGWGPIGIIIAKVFPGVNITMSDINERAVELARKNCALNSVAAHVLQSDGLESVEGMFDAIALNPPIRAGKKAVYSLFDQSLKRLNPNGKLYTVIRKQQGAPSAFKYLEAAFGNAQRIDRDKGYWIILSEKGETNEAK